MNIIEVKDLARHYRKSVFKSKAAEEIKVLKGIDFAVEEHEFVGIMGKSGCGKTTLLKVLGLIDKPTEGSVYFQEKNTVELSGDQLADIRRNQIGFIFQDFYLMNSLNVKENILLPMILNREQVSLMNKTVTEYAEKFEISKLLEKNPYELSGGEQQRVAICRALINNPELILADEPTGNLDSKSGKVVIDSLRSINEDIGKTIIMVSHDPMMASFCKKVILLKDGEILDVLIRNASQDEFYRQIVEKMVEL